MLRDYCDGVAFKQHKLFRIVKNGLQIMLYYDDVEVCNPLGSKAKIHKLSMYMYTILNPLSIIEYTEQDG